MNWRALLRMDMKSLGRLLARGLDWWTGELRGLLPGHARKRRAYLTLEGDRLFQYEPTPAGWTRREVTPRRGAAGTAFALPADKVLVGEFDYPVPSPADLPRMIALDLDRLTPFQATDVVFDVEVAPGPALRGAIRRVTLAVVRRVDLDAFRRDLAARAIEPSALCLLGADGNPRFDFLAAARGTGRGHAGWWLRGAIALLVFANIGIAVLRDETSLAALRDQVDGQRPLVHRVAGLRATVLAEAERRQGLMEKKQGHAALALLERATEALPDDVWLDGFDWDGGRLLLSGYAPAETDVAALLGQGGQFSVTGAADRAGDRFEIAVVPVEVVP
ncbi:MAG: PilN domain-containing protein [Zavarzinia sp.]|nr:PilN domain-containing protein [Zavarzinia sp.]